ncbi:hypothetical protein F1880_010056 [Penicillium rolfsii]|nr:hypothetical protein F1880_010056 [Penicillium rolfsii]
MWREPSEADALKSVLEKDSTAAARSSIRRTNATRRSSSRSTSRARRLMSTFHSHVLDEIQHNMGASSLGLRSPVLNLGVSEDGLDLDTSRREALSRGAARSDSQRLGEHLDERSRRELSEYLAARAGTQSRQTLRPHLTPGFAPAVAQRASTSPRPPTESVHLPPLSLPSMRLSETRPPSVPPRTLQSYRAGNVPSRPSRDSTIDGLGDRQRSLSPDLERENDAWDALLSTITPDANTPTNDPTWSSMIAAQTRRYIESRRNASTLSTILPPDNTRVMHLMLDPYPSTLHPCDLSSSDEDDDDTPVNYHRYIGSSSGPPSVRPSPGVNATMSSHPPIPTISFSFPEPGDPDLQQMQAILDRLARREDIPDHWWAGAGLSRTIGRGLNASAERNANEGNE